ncbi:FMN-binding protein [Streptomyces odontomachi]|uniref:FMN-binding protein n=1 Tax=Streptomyces odontomachi TaxID=2944940 RepID=UPI00210B5467|nr:FMN-binding protein [Streptomyces sp. ODS25]
MRSHPLRRTVLTCVATVTVGVLALSLKPHARPATAVGSSPPRTSPSATSTAGGTRTLTGETVQTRYGPVQVEITLTGSRITAARAVQTPDGDPRSRDIASYSVPVLVHETLDAQSAQIDAVSGASYTSQGYVSSLQSALDKAHG